MSVQGLRPPAPFVAGRVRMEDADEVAALIRAAELVQDGEVETTAADLLRDWRELELARDSVLVRAGGRAVAYGTVACHPRGVLADGYVHPDATGQGLGRYLVRALEERARNLLGGEGSVETGVSLNDATGRSLLESEGYRPVRRFLRMVIDLEAPPSVSAPEGVTIRPSAPGEARDFHRTFEQAFAGHWRHVPQDFETWWERLLEVTDGETSLLFVAEQAGRLIGETHGVRKRFDMGWIGTVGVVPEARGLGVGRALLLRVFAAFWELGERRIGLAVDAENETGATGLYDSAGMHTTLGAIMYEKLLAAGTV